MISSWMLNENHRLRRRNLKTFPAPNVFAHQLVVDADHVIPRLRKTRTVLFAEAPGRGGTLRPPKPADIVFVSFATRWAREGRLFDLLLFIENVPLLHASIVAF
jgi:hypothetical protein